MVKSIRNLLRQDREKYVIPRFHPVVQMSYWVFFVKYIPNEIILPWFGFQSHIFPPMSNVSYELTETFACLPQVPFPLCIYCVHFPGIVL